LPSFFTIKSTQQESLFQVEERDSFQTPSANQGSLPKSNALSPLVTRI
jgi:hypothetical protein